MLHNFVDQLYNFTNIWWPWLFIFNLSYFVQVVLLYLYINMYNYNNIYYILLYVFLSFFFVGVYLSLLQLDLFTAFLWLLECSVIFVFLLLLFFLNVVGVFIQNKKNYFILVFSFSILYYLVLIDFFQEQDVYLSINSYQNNLLDNFYEVLFNFLLNDLYGFSISYYTINFVEFIIVGFLLLLGSVVCVNLNLIGKTISSQNHCNFLMTFKFFQNLMPFFFLRRQNLVNQSNRKNFIKIYTKT